MNSRIFRGRVAPKVNRRRALNAPFLGAAGFEG